MRYALVNPNWDFAGSIYFGCREPHLPLEYGYAKVLLERAGHEAIIIDGQMDGLTLGQIRQQVADYRPDFTVVTTAPSYLFWRCAPPELRVPLEVLQAIGDCGGTTVAVGPHGSTTPRAALQKLGTSVVVVGECEEILPRLAGDWASVPSIAYLRDGQPVVTGGPYSCDMAAMPALHWPAEYVQRHAHQHHRFDAPGIGPGAEMETSRGCPYHCTFCAKDNFRDKYRKRPLGVILEELDALIAQGVEYVYFIDEIFLPNRELLTALVERKIKFGVQTRVDLWNEEMLDLLGRAGCVSVEAGVESITEEGREYLDKKCKVTTEDLAARLIFAKQRIPFVQANLLEMEQDDPAAIQRWREHLQQFDVWSNEPVPLFPYPGSPDYRRRWGAEDDLAWERAHAHYLGSFQEFSDIQESRPRPLAELELVNISHG